MRRAIVTAAGVCVILIGMVHDVVGLGGLRRAVTRGLLAERIATQLMINWAFSGAALALLGLLVVLAAPEMDGAARLPRRVIGSTGAFLVALGVIAYAFQPKPSVLVFTVLGLMLCAPLARRSATFRS